MQSSTLESKSGVSIYFQPQWSWVQERPLVFSKELLWLSPKGVFGNLFNVTLCLLFDRTQYKDLKKDLTIFLLTYRENTSPGFHYISVTHSFPTHILIRDLSTLTSFIKRKSITRIPLHYISLTRSFPTHILNNHFSGCVVFRCKQRVAWNATRPEYWVHI